MTLGLIAGNGRFPFLLLDAARAQGFSVVVAAIREETDPEINHRAACDERIAVYWLSLGELSRLIEVFHKEGVQKAVMAGQVKHKQIFSGIRPDWRLAKLILNLRTRNTDMLLGAVAKVLGDEGIELISSATFLEPLLAQEGVLTARAPDEDERNNIEYGLGVARAVSGFDIGQTVVVAAQACVAVEAMEGTDAAIERAGQLMSSLEEDDPNPASTLHPNDKDPSPGAPTLHPSDKDPSLGAPTLHPSDKDPSLGAPTLARRLTVVKVAKPKQDMRFDVPVIGIATVETMIRAGASCLSVEAGRTLLFDREAMLEHANLAGIAIVASPRGY
jgi:UDP-2,3-diacylglucosamine hydrolase